MTEKNFNKEEFSHAVLIDADLVKVFEFIATGTGITKWFTGNADYFYGDKSIRFGSETAQKGDSFLWKWMKKDLELKGVITESELNKNLSFTFSPYFIVEVKLSEENKRVKLILTQRYQDVSIKSEFAFINSCVSWVFYLTNLKSVIETGNDLRETETDSELLVNL